GGACPGQDGRHGEVQGEDEQGKGERDEVEAGLEEGEEPPRRPHRRTAPCRPRLPSGGRRLREHSRVRGRKVRRTEVIGGTRARAGRLAREAVRRVEGRRAA